MRFSQSDMSTAESASTNTDTDSHIRCRLLELPDELELGILNFVEGGGLAPSKLYCTNLTDTCKDLQRLRRHDPLTTLVLRTSQDVSNCAAAIRWGLRVPWGTDFRWGRRTLAVNGIQSIVVSGNDTIHGFMREAPCCELVSCQTLCRLPSSGTGPQGNLSEQTRVPSFSSAFTAANDMAAYRMTIKTGEKLDLVLEAPTWPVRVQFSYITTTISTHHVGGSGAPVLTAHDTPKPKQRVKLLKEVWVDLKHTSLCSDWWHKENFLPMRQEPDVFPSFCEGLMFLNPSQMDYLPWRGVLNVLGAGGTEALVGEVRESVRTRLERSYEVRSYGSVELQTTTGDDGSFSIKTIRRSFV